MTYSMEVQGKVRGVLAQNGVEYETRTRGNGGGIFGDRHMAGSFGINQNYAYEYSIYVRREDFDKALYLIRSLL